MAFVVSAPSVWNVLSPVLATWVFIIHISVQISLQGLSHSMQNCTLDPHPNDSVTFSLWNLLLLPKYLFVYYLPHLPSGERNPQ